MIDLNQLKAFKKEAHGAGYESENPKNEIKVSDVDQAYLFLRKALRAKEDPPIGEAGESFRGPKEFSEGKFQYTNNWQGTLENYSGKEKIYLDGNLVYTAMYMGGSVDQRVED